MEAISLKLQVDPSQDKRKQMCKLVGEEHSYHLFGFSQAPPEEAGITTSQHP